MINQYAELSGSAPATSPTAAYVMLDGVFQRALLCSLSGMDTQVGQLEEELPRVLDLLVAGNAT